MALSEADAVAIERLAPGDAESGLALSVAAGWNQTALDWRFFIGAGRVLGCRDDAGRLVATAAALPHGPRAAWISMVLVAAEARHRGLATALVGECIAALRAEGRSPLLDATPAGAAVYRRLGFSAGFGFERWEGPGDGSAGAGVGEASSRAASPMWPKSRNSMPPPSASTGRPCCANSWPAPRRGRGSAPSAAAS